MSNTPESPLNPVPPEVPVPAVVVAPVTPAAAPPVALPASPLPPRQKPPQKTKDGIGDASLSQIIDTIEAIIIALIVALTFRAFIVEAFVIPTGSMGPTLLGAHFKVICPKCGYEYDLEADLAYQVRKDQRDQRVIPGYMDRETHSELRNNSGIPWPLDNKWESELDTCPNCRYRIAPEQLPQFLRDLSRIPIADGRRPGGPKPADFVWANNGDRILVLKFLYSIMEPSRWDVIVFKEPQSTQDNYIKRLVGLPGDTVQIINGDVFIWPASPTGVAPDPANFQIARKPDYLQQNLWQLVYDNDHYPVDAAGGGNAAAQDVLAVNPRTTPFRSPWESTAAWTAGPVMTYAGDGPASLSFNLEPPQAKDAPYTLNTLGYNNDFHAGWASNMVETTPRSYVGDLRLETVWSPLAGTPATIDLTLGRPANCYRVSWTAAGLKLLRLNPTSKEFEPVAGASIASMVPEAGKSYRLAMNNVDRSVQFYIDGVKVISYEEPWTAAKAIAEEQQFPSLYQADAEALGRQYPMSQDFAPGALNTIIRVDVGGRCSLAHLKLLRDLYYTQVYGWGEGNPPTGTKGHPIHLNQDEFFAMGDNSRKSSDSRFWKSTFDAAGDLGLRNGVVPRRYLLGKAFFVYWPAGYRSSDSLPMLKDLPLVPNMGETRIIR